MTTRTVLFAGGGTGGHIFPALAIAESLRERDPAARLIFVCSDRPLDSAILSREGVEFRPIPAKPVGLRPGALLRFARSWGPSVRAVRAMIRAERERGHDVRVVTTGGFVAAPAAQAAKAQGAHLTLVNLDAIPGKANRWIAKRANRIVSSLPARGFTWPRIPPIVRRAARAQGDAAACRAALGLDPKSPTLLVTGASQGARSINGLLLKLAADHPRAFKGWQVIHQTGANEDAEVRAAYRKAGIPAEVRPFFDRMAEPWGAADFAVSRAGAGSVAEAWANSTPTLFLPYPFHRDQHQKHNAAPLVEPGGALLAEDLIDEARNAAGAGKVILALLADPVRRDAMRHALHTLGPADGADRIADLLSPAD